MTLPSGPLQSHTALPQQKREGRKMAVPVVLVGETRYRPTAVGYAIS